MCNNNTGPRGSNAFVSFAFSTTEMKKKRGEMHKKGKGK